MEKKCISLCGAHKTLFKKCIAEGGKALKTLQRYASFNRDQLTQYSEGIRAKLWPWGEDMYTQTSTKSLPYLLKLFREII